MSCAESGWTVRVLSCSPTPAALPLYVAVIATGFTVPDAAGAQTPPVRDVHLSADSIEIGDRFDLRFTVRLPAGRVAFFPGSVAGAGLEPFDGVAWTAEADSDGGTRIEVTYPLLAYRTGSLAVPALDVFVAPAGEATSAGYASPGDPVGSWSAFLESPGALPSARLVAVPEQRVHVATVLALDDVTTQIAPRPPADVSGGDRDWVSTLLLGAFGVLLLGVTVASARDWSRMRNATPPPPLPSPRERALAAMDDILATGSHRDGRIRDFYDGWSGVVRRYLEGFEEAWGPSWTSTELMSDLQGRRRSVAIARSLGPEGIAREMRLAEEVKFGGLRPEPEEAEAHWKRARDWIAGSAT